jgi:pimeloyl-ACP methyl ester carboxylesterase
MAVADWQRTVWSAHIHDARLAGRSLRYVDLGDGDPLVLIHGTGGAWQSWLLNLEPLAARHRVIAVDLPGFGCSARLPAAPDMRQYAASLVELLDQLGLGRVTVLGHSLGGVVAMRFALDHPERTASLVLVDGGGVALTPLRLWVVVRMLFVINALFSRRAVVRALVRRPRLRRLAMAGFVRDPAIADGPFASEVLGVFAAPGLVDAVKSAASDDVGDHAERIAAPTLLLWGNSDPVIPLAVAEELSGRLRRSRLEAMHGVGHCPMLEQPERFNARVADWVDEVGKWTRAR